jgi:hypothetical protein
MSCFQCDLDIDHVCYAGQPRARWGWTDEAIAALEAAQHFLDRRPDRRTGQNPRARNLGAEPSPAPDGQKRQARRPLKSKRRPR